MKRNNGFTLTELMFATAFLAFLLLFVVTAMMQYMQTYNKGLTYKAINQTGRSVFEEVTRNMRVASANILQMDEGRLCVGGQTYVWNTSTTNNKYEDSNENVEGVIRLPDSTGELCLDGGDGLPAVPKGDETVIATSRVAVQSFTGDSAGDGSLYHLSLVLSTSGANAPENNGGNMECPPGREGQFCAMASFQTHIATRR